MLVMDMAGDVGLARKGLKADPKASLTSQKVNPAEMANPPVLVGKRVSRH